MNDKPVCENCGAVIKNIYDHGTVPCCPYCGLPLSPPMKLPEPLPTSMRSCLFLYVKKHLLSTLILLASLFFTFSVTFSLLDFYHDYKIMQARSDGKIHVGCSRDYVGENYEAVVEQLHILGLNNIETINLDHFCIFPFQKETVDSIYINGVSDFDDDYYVYPDVQVIIRYL